MIDPVLAEEIRTESDAAMMKIGNDPERLAELSDDDLLSVAVHYKALVPLLEATLLGFCAGDVERANAALKRVGGFKDSKLLRLVRDGTVAMKTHRNATAYQHAALLYNAQVGVAAIQIEQERRAAMRGRAMN